MNAQDMKQNYLMVRLQFWTYREYGIPILCRYSQVHLELEGSNLLGSHQCVKQNNLIIYYIWNDLTGRKKIIVIKINYQH